MKTPRFFFAALLAVSALTATAFAADPSGTWKWTSMTKAGGPSEVTAVLVLKKGVLTGTVTGRQGPADITDATVKGDDISFTVTRMSGIVTVVFKYAGTVTDNAITGTIERTTSEDKKPTKSDWKATRAK